MIVYYLLILGVLAFGLLTDEKIPQLSKYKSGALSWLKYLENKNVYILLVFCSLFSISTIRRDVGTDYHAYKFLFDSGEHVGLEKGFSLLNKMVKHYGFGFEAVVAICSLVTIGAFSYVIYRASAKAYLSFFVFVSFYFYFFSFNIMRQYVAISLCFLGVYYLLKNKRVFFIILVLIAATFHKSAIVMLVLIVIHDWKFITRNMVTSILVASVAILYLVPQYSILELAGFLKIDLYTYWDQYRNTTILENTPFSLAGKLKFTIIGMALIALSRLYSKFKSEDKKLFLIMTLFYFLSCFKMTSELVSRQLMYLEVFAILVYPNAISYIKDKRLYRLAVSSLVVYGLFWFTVVLMRNTADVMPYLTIFK